MSQYNADLEANFGDEARNFPLNNSADENPLLNQSVFYIISITLIVDSLDHQKDPLSSQPLLEKAPWYLTS